MGGWLPLSRCHGRSRGLPLVKWFLAIPHCIVLFFLWIGAVVGAQRWSLRVEAYAILLITDQYPPFSLSK